MIFFNLYPQPLDFPEFFGELARVRLSLQEFISLDTSPDHWYGYGLQRTHHVTIDLSEMGEVFYGNLFDAPCNVSQALIANSLGEYVSS